MYVYNIYNIVICPEYSIIMTNENIYICSTRKIDIITTIQSNVQLERSLLLH